MMRTKSTEGRVPSSSHSDALHVSLCSTLGNILQGVFAEAAHLCSQKAEQLWEGAPARWACRPAGQLAGLGGTASSTGAWGPPLQRLALCLARHRACCLSGLQAWWKHLLEHNDMLPCHSKADIAVMIFNSGQCLEQC